MPCGVPFDFFMNPSCQPEEALAAVFCGHGEPFDLRRYPVPQPGAGECLVRVSCATICGSDVHTWHGRRQEPTPCVLGHEIVGRIEAFGENAPKHDLRGRELRVGDRVTWTVAASCGECFFCREGLPQKCGSLFKYGHTALSPAGVFHGGFAEVCLLAPGTGILRLPDNLSDEDAAPANCAVATVAAVMRHAGVIEGRCVAVLGCGVLGLTACAMARALGAGMILACDLDASRGASALEMGASSFHTPDGLAEAARELTGGRGADFALEFAGPPEAVELALAVLRTGGTAVIAGTTIPGRPVALDAHQLMRRMLTVRGVHNYAPEDLVTAVDFLVRPDFQPLIARIRGEAYPLEGIEDAFAAAAATPGRRVVLRSGRAQDGGGYGTSEKNHPEKPTLGLQ
jgi:putative phosphonate catabolism associated alcohol dehydrogenase